jgi:hypothetical protein
MVLGGSAQAQKHSTKNVRQSFHLVNPPEFEFVGGRSKERHRETRPFQAATAYSKLGQLAK